MQNSQLLDELINIVIKENGSDLHLSEERNPVIRVAGYLIPLVKIASLTRENIDGFLSELLLPENKKEFLEKKELDFGFSNRNARFRGNAFYSLGRMSISLRLIPKQIRTLQELNLPDILATFAKRQQGFFMVVGPTGHGKSTTLATLVDMINRDRLEHIVTIEDPIEYIIEPLRL